MGEVISQRCDSDSEIHRTDVHLLENHSRTLHMISGRSCSRCPVTRTPCCVVRFRTYSSTPCTTPASSAAHSDAGVAIHTGAQEDELQYQHCSTLPRNSNCCHRGCMCVVFFHIVYVVHNQFVCSVSCSLLYQICSLNSIDTHYCLSGKICTNDSGCLGMGRGLVCHHTGDGRFKISIFDFDPLNVSE